MFSSVLPEIAVKPPALEQPGLDSFSSYVRRKSRKQSGEGPATVSEENDGSDQGGARKKPGLFRQKSVRRVSSRCVVEQQEVPAHLLKFLHKTPEQQQRLNAVKLILADEPSVRNEMSLDIVYDWMLQNCKQYSNNIFGSAPEYIRREICRQMRLLKVMSHGVIIRQGDSGDRCYIVINGIVDVYIKNESDLIPADPLEERSTKPPLLSRRSRRGSVEPAVMASSVKDFGGMVANLGPGAMFGEIVLMNPTTKRNATITASQYTECSELICLERADYIRLVRMASMEASHYNHTEILDQMHLFQGWDKHGVLVPRGLGRKVDVCHHVRRGHGAHQRAIASSSSSASTLSDPMLPRQFLTPRHGSGGPSKKTPEKKVNVELALIGPGDIAGEVPFVTAKWKARFDIKAVTDVQTLAIERRFYETAMMSATFESNKAMCTTMQLLKKIASEREDWRQQRLECGTTYPNAHISITAFTDLSFARASKHLAAHAHVEPAVSTLRHKRPFGGRYGTMREPSADCDWFKRKQRQSWAADGCLPHKEENVLGQITRTIRSYAFAQVTLGLSLSYRPDNERGQNTMIRTLFDDAYLPTAKEQLAHCRRNTTTATIATSQQGSALSSPMTTDARTMKAALTAGDSGDVIEPGGREHRQQQATRRE